jgi:hypothetical protein
METGTGLAERPSGMADSGIPGSHEGTIKEENAITGSYLH